MGRTYGLLLLLFTLLGFKIRGGLCQDDAAVYIVTLKQVPPVHYIGEIAEMKSSGIGQISHGGFGRLDTGKPSNASRTGADYSSFLIRFQNSLLRRALKGESYLKLYSYHFLINGFAVLITRQQADRLSKRREVANVELDFSVRTATTYTPEFLGLPQGAWVEEGGPEFAGKGIVIGFIDTGIDPTHPSFSDVLSDTVYPVPAHFSGVCEVTTDFPSGSCNRKLVGARHFAASAITRGIFNASKDHASPFDGDGHGTHTASIAAGNHGVPVNVSGHHFGNASGMAPHAHVAVYKALYKSFGGFAADVVAAIDQAAQDGVDIISLSITPNRRPPGLATFFNPLDMALLAAVKAGIFVVQAAGNTGPSPKSMSSFSPWIFSVGASAHDRVYNNFIVLGNNLSISGVGLAPGTDGDLMYTLISATHALRNDSDRENNFYVSECQDPSHLNQDLVKGNIIICSYSIRYVLGLSSVKQALVTAKNVSAAGIIFYMDPFVLGFQLNPTPMDMPGAIIPSPDDSKVCENFAMISGTSMAAPHVAGLAALLKQKFPSFSPSAIASALSTTATLYDKQGGPIMAQRAYSNPDSSQSPATPFDMGSGFVNATAALDPGIIFDADYDDYISFLCGINGSTPIVLNYTGNNCDSSTINGTDLNLPSVTVALLNQSRTVTRRLTNIANDETYSVSFSAPYAVSLSVVPIRFSIAKGETQNLTFVLTATMNSSSASFGRVGLYGSRGHISMIPLSVIVKIAGNMSTTKLK
ncbi:hypothetical protein KFK09_002734 [Dendrobium nobile]|uniref:Subtilisin-like protease SBT2.2 n=1 Tax=Dendrobium nobile TaxID=94219 RepID=A0A8T3C7Z2_DENNO|nr:hypothetical protein KFK09_002734 [Dendrobium nobile]